MQALMPIQAGLSHGARPTTPASEPGVDRVREILAAVADHPSAGVALSRGMHYFSAADGQGVIAYREAGRYLFQLGSVYASATNRQALLQGFLDFARARRRRVCALQLRDDDVPLFRRAGFRLNQMGLSYSLCLDEVPNGGKYRSIRHSAYLAARAGVEVLEINRDLPASPELLHALEQVTAQWLRQKGKHKKLIEFLVGDLAEYERGAARCFVARLAGRVVAFHVFSPAHTRLPGVAYDICRRVPGAPPGVAELINLRAIERFRAEGLRFMHFGLTPFVGVDDVLDEHSRALARVIRLLARHGGALYPAATQAANKLKWHPRHITPEYFAFQGRFRLSALVQLVKLTRAL